MAVLYDYVQREPGVTKYETKIPGVISAESAGSLAIFACGLLAVAISFFPYKIV